ncbi:gonadotropin releasing hormone receptor 1 isoform X2 [Hippocampus comes]|uniref:gonadotropin releasing hormone receptor 1 isoform X2 n=1 Tax=Hippocampus comes TaxID=109280 RepID=UPI00094F23A1|nr:PREDICTED: gonadotropin-releasing hormone II receptor-like isoform X2 [Hippocampus comes]
MPGNLSLRLSTPAPPLFKGSAPPAAPNGTSPEWEAPTFTVAARCRVAATLALFVFAALSNLSVLISVRWGRGYRLAAHLRPLIASLASADLLMTFVVMPLDAVWNMTVQWYAGDVLCKLLCFLKLFAMHSAAFILIVVSLDRYRAILHPLDSLDAGLRNKRMLLVAWMLSLLLASPQITGQMRKSKDGERCLRRSGKDQIPRARMKTLKMSIVIVSSFVICWTPYYLLGIWYWFQPTMIRHTPEYVHHILFVFSNLNTCCDPVIYGFYTTSFRADLVDAMACCRDRRAGEDSPRSADGLAARNAAPAGEMESDLSSNPHSGNL